jgi:copper(I)-binding protein
MRIVHVLVNSLFMLAPALAAANGLEGRDGWIREAPPQAPVRAGYVELRNGGPADVVLTGARSEAFGAIEVHEMVGEGDLMRMRRLQELRVPAGGTVTLQPGGRHLMLFRPQRPLQAGDTVVVTLELVDGSSVDIELTQR